MKNIWKIFLASIIGLIVILQLITLFQLQTLTDEDIIHTMVFNWSMEEVGADQVISGYVASWNPSNDIRITAIQVWMGNPSKILWEGDVYVVLNDKGNFQSPDQVIVHYQFDKHAEGSAPHHRLFQIGDENLRFRVDKDQIIYVWRAFKNISDQSVKSGDGQVIIYYVED